MIDVTQALGPDYFLVWGELSDAERDARFRTRSFVDEHVLPTIDGYWERAEFPRPLIEQLATLEVVGGGIDGYGCPELGPVACGLVQMELARSEASLATFVGVQSGLSMGSIALLGSEEQKRHWLPRLARLEAIGAFALTEPDHGSDSVSLETTARRDGDVYLVDGTKRWIGNGSIADVVVVWARVEDGAVNGFLVERPAPGYEAEVIQGMGSLRAVWQADIRLDGVRVPAENRLPGAESFRDVSAVLTETRASVAWAALGQATAAYEIALAYTSSRIQFGRPLCSFQIVQNRLVQMLDELTSMQLYCLQIGRLSEAGRLTGPMASLAKLHNTRKARKVIAEARDLLGGNGILLERHVMRHLADIEALHTYEGMETIQTLIVGREITGIAAFA